MSKLAYWSSEHRRWVVVLWIAVLVTAMGVSRAVGSHYSNNFSLPGTDAQRAANLLSNGFRAQSGDSDQIVLHALTGTLAAPATRARVGWMLGRVARLPHVASVVSPYAPGTSALSQDGRIGFATVTFDERANVIPVPAIKNVMATAEKARSASLQVELGGQAIEQAQFGSIGYTTLIGIGAAVVVLLISFGSLLAMGLPVVTALFGLGTGLGLIGLSSRLLSMPDISSQLALMIGLGVGVDYALFIVTRYREAYRRNGHQVQPAVTEAMNTAGRAVIFAGATVIIALMGMFTLGLSFLYGLAVSSSLAVLLVLCASLTLLPALLTFTGHRIGKPGLLVRRRAPHRSDESVFWSRRAAPRGRREGEADGVAEREDPYPPGVGRLRGAGERHRDSSAGTYCSQAAHGGDRRPAHRSAAREGLEGDGARLLHDRSGSSRVRHHRHSAQPSPPTGRQGGVRGALRHQMRGRRGQSPSF